jgi:hypothetical protein
VLEIPAAKLAFIVLKAREFDVKDAPTDLEIGSNPTDDGSREILEDYPGDSTEQELADALASLNHDELDEVVALTWLGRGDYDQAQWGECLRQARSNRDGHAVRYLMGTPMLGDLIEEGAAALGYSLAEEEAKHL